MQKIEDQEIEDLGFHWRSNISWKSKEQIVCRGYDVNDLAENAGFISMVFLLLRGNLPNRAEHRMLDFLMTAFAEHAFSPSAVAARMAAAGRPPLNAAIAAGILSFGEAHGPGHIYSRKLTECLSAAHQSGIEIREAAEKLVRDHLASGEKIPGLHQPQHTDGDPRASVMIAKALQLGIAGEYSQLQREIVSAYAMLTERKLHVNVLGAAGSVLLDMGFRPNACWAIGILSRAFSCAAHAIEEMEDEAAWRATSSDGKANILSLSLQGERHYNGEQLRPVPRMEN